MKTTKNSTTALFTQIFNVEKNHSKILLSIVQKVYNSQKRTIINDENMPVISIFLFFNVASNALLMISLELCNSFAPKIR